MRLRTLILALVALIAAAPTPIQPGKWQTTVTVVDAAIPGAPPQVAAMLRGRPTTVSACVTPADAAAGPRAVVEKSNGRCRYTSYQMAGGRISSTMQCSTPQGPMTVKSSGSYTPTTLTADGMMTGAGGMTMKTHTVGRRVGAC